MYLDRVVEKSHHYLLLRRIDKNGTLVIYIKKKPHNVSFSFAEKYRTMAIISWSWQTLLGPVAIAIAVSCFWWHGIDGANFKMRLPAEKHSHGKRTKYWILLVYLVSIYFDNLNNQFYTVFKNNKRTLESIYFNIT